MHSKEVIINGITYTVSSTTPEGVKRGIAKLKRDLKKMFEQDETKDSKDEES
jgi:hypothetical protein